ncbi:hypothetical protein [Bacillus paramycoides]|nr:hypothetical protein [Bacillus paramycoides]
MKKKYIEMDIEKALFEGKRVPIDDELANMIADLIDYSIQKK